MNAKIGRVAIIAAALVVAMGLFAYMTLTPSVAASSVNNQQDSNQPNAPWSHAYNSDQTNFTCTYNQTSAFNQSNAFGNYSYSNGFTNGYPSYNGNNNINNQCQQFQQDQQGVEASLTVGQVINLTSTQGTYRVVGNSSETGTASGTLTFDVTGNLTRGYILSLTGGSIVVNGTTYTITSGSAQTGSSAQTLTGQGETSPSGDFLVSATASGNFGGSTAHVTLDFSNGTTEYEISLICTVVG